MIFPIFDENLTFPNELKARKEGASRNWPCEPNCNALQEGLDPILKLQSQQSCRTNGDLFLPYENPRCPLALLCDEALGPSRFKSPLTKQLSLQPQVGHMPPHRRQNHKCRRARWAHCDCSCIHVNLSCEMRVAGTGHENRVRQFDSMGILEIVSRSMIFRAHKFK